MIDISSYITDDVNLIEIYLASNKDGNKINVEITNDVIERIKSSFKISKEAEFVYYHNNNLTYIYDKSNDSQLTITRSIIKDEYKITNKKYDLYLIALNETKLPNHYFPCTNDIDNKEEFKVIEIRINNRICLLIKNNQVIIQYRHNSIVDIDKIKETLQFNIRKIINLI